MTDVLIYAATTRSPELRHELPLSIIDAVLYLEKDGERHVVATAMEVPRLSELPGVHVHGFDEFGVDELVRRGLARHAIELEIALRAVDAIGLRAASVPPDFPLELADRLRAAGVELSPERDLFARRRRVKNDHELAGIRRAQTAAEAGMEAARRLFRRARETGRTVTVEDVKAAIDERFGAHGCTGDELIVSHGWQAAIGHHSGDGEIGRDEAVVIDLWPRDKRSGCYADMTRTFVIGEPSDELRAWHELTKRALDRAVAETRSGVPARSLYDGTCEIFEAAGYPTHRTKEAGAPLEHGFVHALGHGVGLDLHEPPNIGLSSHDDLVAGDVVSLEPGLYRRGVGGCRLEDLVVVTDAGADNLTDFPYDLAP